MQFNIEIDESFTIPVKIYNEEEYHQIAECGARRLFEFGEFVFMDSIDAKDHEHYLVGISVWDEERLDFFMSLELKNFYELVALVFNDKTEQLLRQWLQKMLVSVFAMLLSEQRSKLVR